MRWMNEWKVSVIKQNISWINKQNISKFWSHPIKRWSTKLIDISQHVNDYNSVSLIDIEPNSYAIVADNHSYEILWFTASHEILQ